MTSSNTSVVQFDSYELDPFHLYDDPEEIEELDPAWSDYADKQFGETDKNRDDMVQKLKTRAMEETDLKLPDKDSFYLKILRAGGFTVEGGLRVLRAYFNHMRDCPQYFKDAHPDLVNHVFQENLHFISPHRDQFGRRVIIYRSGVMDPDIISFNEVYCVGYMLSELMGVEQKTQIAGVTCIADAAGFGWKQLTCFGIEDAKNGAQFVQESFPLFFRAIHVVNAPRLFHMCYAAFKPFLSDAVRNSVIFHSSLESLHKYVSPEILPKEYGGHLEPMSSAEIHRSIQKMEPFFKRIKGYGHRLQQQQQQQQQQHPEKKQEDEPNATTTTSSSSSSSTTCPRQKPD